MQHMSSKRRSVGTKRVSFGALFYWISIEIINFENYLKSYNL